MAKCPDGHESAADDYCDVCGMLMAGGVSASVPAASGASPAPASPAPASPTGGSSASPAAAEPCPQCNAPRSGQFCEACGYNFDTGEAPPSPSPSSILAPTKPTATPDPASQPEPLAAPAPTSLQAPAPVSSPDAAGPAASAWSVVVTADRGYYDAMRAASDEEEADIPFPSYCPERRFQLSGTEIQIGRRSPSRGLDPEIDLTGPPLDPGVSRLQAVLIATPDGGWAVLDPGSANGTQVNGTDIASGVQVPLHDGDRISVGAWTTITVRGG